MQSKRTSLKHTAATIGTSLVLLFGGLIAAPGAWADSGSLTDDTVTATDVQQSLTDVTSDDSGLVQTATPSISTGSDAAVAISGTSGATVSIPKDPSDGVDVTGPGLTPVTIGLPNADAAKDATKLSDGAVAYAATDGSANAVIPTATGPQLLTMIANAQAPTSYRYSFGLPVGDTLRLYDDGRVQINDASGTMVYLLSAAWAQDANGNSVPSHYEVDGTDLIQVVDHVSAPDVAYPVVADPSFSCGFLVCTVQFNKNETQIIAAAGAAGATTLVTLCARGGTLLAFVCAVNSVYIVGTAFVDRRYGNCLELHAAGIPPAVTWWAWGYSGGYCR